MNKPIRVLLVEENPEDIERLRNELQAAGMSCEFKCADSEGSFFKELQSFNPDLILSDYQTESLDGSSLLKRVRETHKHLPFIFVSWLVHEETVTEAMRQGATDYVFKDQLSRLPFSVLRALREAEEKYQLEHVQEKMAERERLNAFGQMASGIAHDFSNALMPVLGYSELLLNRSDDLMNSDKLRYYLKMMNMAAKDAVNIVGRLREFYQKRHPAESFSPVDLNQVVEFTILFTRPKWKDQALSRGAVIKIETDMEKLPKVHGNDTSLREVLTNLIFNAVDAMPKGGVIRVRAYAEPLRAVLEVSDSGVGMDEETCRRCFEPFYSTKGKRGSGLGLSMVREIVERHEGTVEVRSRKGGGTTFAIRLPFYFCKTGAVHAAASEERLFEPLSKKLNILILDDEAASVEVMAEYLTADGHETYSAASALEGMEKDKGRSFDLIVTDWILPDRGAGGHAWISQIRQLYPSVPVIMMTGFAELSQVRLRKNETGVTLLKKPPTLLSVREAIFKSVPAAA